MPFQSALATVGVAKQTVKGTPIATATFGHGVTDGAVQSVDVQQGLEDRTSGYLDSPEVNRTGVVTGEDYTTRVFAGSVGLYLLGALGADAVTGTGPYTHTITCATSIPYLTTFGTYGGSFLQLQDVKIDQLVLSWQENEPLELQISATGTKLNPLGSAYTTTNDETQAAYFRPVGATLSLDVDGAGSTAATSKITSGEITISNNIEAYMVSGTITPDDVFEGRREVECSFDVVPDDLALWRTIWAGTSAGTSASGAVVYGTFSVQFTLGTASLTLASSRVAFTCDFPDADPSGGKSTLSLAGLAARNGATGPITATLVNSIATY